jgi:hypothetical protein
VCSSACVVRAGARGTAFLVQSQWRSKDFFYFDWLLRDLFAFLYAQANRFVLIPGANKPIFLGNDWQSRALTAYGRAASACDYERDSRIIEAGDEWQRIFGFDIPRSV